MNATKFRKKPVEIEAMQFTGDNADAIAQWMGEGYTYGPLTGDLRIHTLEGDMHVSDGDYVIRGVKGEYYPCKPDIFTATYEPVSAEPNRLPVRPGHGYAAPLISTDVPKVTTGPAPGSWPSYRAFLGERPCDNPDCPCHP